MAQYSMNINEYVSKNKVFIKSDEEFYDHIDTIKLNYFEGKINKPTTEFKSGKTVKVNHISNVFITLELLEKGMIFEEDARALSLDAVEVQAFE